MVGYSSADDRREWGKGEKGEGDGREEKGGRRGWGRLGGEGEGGFSSFSWNMAYWAWKEELAENMFKGFLKIAADV